MIDIKNAAPMVIDQGTRDLSTTTASINTLVTPQHLPKFYIFAEKGPIGPNFVDLGQDTLSNLYGDETFNVNKKYYTHQTPFLQVVAAAGNNCVVHRLVATQSRDRSNVVLYLDVLPTQVPVYTKNSDGSIMLASNGDPVTVKDSNGTDITVAGYKVCWVSDYSENLLDEYYMGGKPIRQGIQTEGGTQSQQYPIFELCSADVGEFGNRLGIRIFPALQADQNQFPSNYLNDAKTYPYYFQAVKLMDEVSGKVFVLNDTDNSQYARFVAKKDSVDPVTGMVVGFDKTISNQYVAKTSNGNTGIGGSFTYYNNIDTVLELFYNTEKVISDPHRDTVINNTSSNYHAFNFVSFTSSNGSAYQTVKQITVTGSVRLTKNTNLFMRGAYDGVMSNELLDELVANDMDLYDSPTSEYNDLVMHPESIIYDSGFTLSTKKVLPKFISRRKDTFIVLSTFAHNSPSTLLADQYSLGVALKTMLELYPESDSFGTPVMRGMIMGSSGLIIGSPYRKRVPVAYELAYKAARYMGASTGKWKSGFCFDKAPLSVLTQLSNIESTWVPSLTRNAMWSVGLNFPLNYKIKTQFFPALQTVYENDTSVLNSFFTAVAVSYLNKIAHSAWREFTGTISLSNAQLEERVNSFVTDILKDAFDGKFVVVPAAKVTEEDALRGFSWTLPIKIYANNMVTVMATSVEAYRMDALGR